MTAIVQRHPYLATVAIPLVVGAFGAGAAVAVNAVTNTAKNDDIALVGLWAGVAASQAGHFLYAFLSGAGDNFGPMVVPGILCAGVSILSGTGAAAIAGSKNPAGDDDTYPMIKGYLVGSGVTYLVVLSIMGSVAMVQRN
jgi:hypothetical protein